MDEINVMIIGITHELRLLLTILHYREIPEDANFIAAYSDGTIDFLIEAEDEEPIYTAIDFMSYSDYKTSLALA